MVLIQFYLGYFSNKKYIDIHIYIYIYIHIYIHTHIHTYTYTYIHTYTLTYTHTYIHTYTYTHTYIYIYTPQIKIYKMINNYLSSLVTFLWIIWYLVGVYVDDVTGTCYKTEQNRIWTPLSLTGVVTRLK